MNMKQEVPKRKRLDASTSRVIIDTLGGTVAVAQICGIKSPSVSEWKVMGITRPYLLFLREKFSTLPVMKQPSVLDF